MFRRLRIMLRGPGSPLGVTHRDHLLLTLHQAPSWPDPVLSVECHRNFRFLYYVASL